MRNRRDTFDLFLVSALGLFVELIFIRWVASELRIVAFYKNFALIAAFLGLGLGFAYRLRQTHKKLFERYFFPLLAAATILILFLGRTQLSEVILLNRTDAQEFIWAGLLIEQNPGLLLFLDLGFYAVLLGLFLIITLLFIPMGELTARKFAAFSPLSGYTINILGSLAGILLYTLISFLGWPPSIWFLLVGIAGVYFLLQSKQRLYVNLAFAAIPILLALLWPTGADQTLWSPYYRIDIQAKYGSIDSKVQLGHELSVNKAWHQRLWNLEPGFVSENYAADPGHFDTMQSEYDLPYQLARSLDNVLIVGAGTGNDAAGALRSGAKQVVAVEIDPLILKIGRELHPEDPYADSTRVIQIAQDARSFFRTDDQKYDLIVFGLLDSHTLFSTASSVRLDNFVYTQESLEEARNLLKKDGLLALSFGVPPTNEWVGFRLYRTLTDVFGHSPHVYEFLNSDIIFLISQDPAYSPVINDPRVIPRPDYVYLEELGTVTDNWPYLYLRDRTIPNTYLIGLTGVILISLLLIRRVIPDFRQINLHFFFLGSAFFLLETKSVTEMALLFGSTWIVNAVVIAAILTMIVLANLLVRRLKINNVQPFYILLFASLIFDYFIPVGSYLGLPLFWRVSLASIAQAIPLFFAGIIFAITFSQTDSIEIALGSNLFGSVLGGILEYGSLIFGIRSLYLLALFFYLLSAVVLRLQRTWRVQPAET